MATKVNKKGNTLKEIDVNKWTKPAIEKRGLSYKTLRKRYSEYRAIAVKRQKSLAAKGYGKMPEVTQAKFPTLKELDARNIDVELYLKMKMKQVVEFLNNPLTLVRNQGRRQEIKSMKTLQLHGYNIYDSNFEAFIDFMQKLRSRGLGLLEDSDRAAKYFSEHWRPDMDLDTFIKSFEKYRREDDADKIENLKLLHPDDYKERAMLLPGIDKKRLSEIEKYIGSRSAQRRRDRAK